MKANEAAITESPNAVYDSSSSGKGGLMSKLVEGKRKVAEKDAIKEYDVEITETSQMTVSVEAKCPEEAEAMVRADYRNGMHILDYNHLTSTVFSVTEDEVAQNRSYRSDIIALE